MLKGYKKINNKIYNKMKIFKNFLVSIIVLLIISLIFIFNIRIGFSVFENIKTIHTISFTIIFIIAVNIIILIVFLGIYRIRKNLKEFEKLSER